MSAALHRLLRVRAAEAGCSINDVLVAIVDAPTQAPQAPRPANAQEIAQRAASAVVPAAPAPAALAACDECLAPAGRTRSRLHRASCSRFTRV